MVHTGREFIGTLPRSLSALMFSNTALEPTPVGRLNSAFAVDIAAPAWLSSGR